MKMHDFFENNGLVCQIKKKELLNLPFPFENPEEAPRIRSLEEGKWREFEVSLDGVMAIGISKPKTEKEEREFINRFLSGLKKLLSEDDNWTFFRPLFHSLEYCQKCQLCSEACPIYLASGRKEIYRPTFRGEILRRIIEKYLKRKGFFSKFKPSDFELTFSGLARLGELSYRCTLCRKCAQVCPLGVDNALIAREIRKLFSQELGIAPKELHELGTMKHLKIGSPTGITPEALKDLVRFIEEDIGERTGERIKIPIDKEGAEILFLHNAGEFLSFPENLEAFAIIFHRSRIDWTLSSELMGYDAVNYGLWYDDVQLMRIALKQVEISKALKVKRIVLGECGHAHKALLGVADRILLKELTIPRESSLILIEKILQEGKIKLDPRRNDFPVTLHDPCGIVRGAGIVEAQRRILRKICLDFREMNPCGVENYCCGGGSGFAVIRSANFPDWRNLIAGRMKLKQIVEVFQDVISSDINKYLCAPCSNCKAQIRDLFSFYKVWEKCRIFYGGFAELVVNAMVDLKRPFIEWEWR